MKTADKIMIYDDSCPMCAAYTKAFVNTGLLAGAGRQSFSNADKNLLSQIDPVKSRHEIPLIDTKKKTILYGIDAMLEVIGNKLPLVKRLGTFKPINFFLKKLYKLVSYNRRVITASTTQSIHFDCTPDFNLPYRILLLGIGFCFNTLMLSPTYHNVFIHSIFSSATANQLQIAHLAFVSFNILLATRLTLKRAIDFLGQINLIGIMYSLLMIPLIIVNHLFIIPHLINTILLFAVFFLMILEYKRRMKYAGILQNTSILVLDAILAVLFLGYLAYA